VLPDLFERRLNELHPDGRAGLLRADAVRYSDGRTDLALTWLHMLFDGWGSERFVEFLEQCRSGARAPDAVPAADRPGAPPDVALPERSSERGNMAMEWQRWMNGLGRLPVRSPAGPERGARQDLVIARTHLSHADGERVRFAQARRPPRAPGNGAPPLRRSLTAGHIQLIQLARADRYTVGRREAAQITHVATVGPGERFRHSATVA